MSGSRKLGDGTVATLALHIAESYLRIAGFLQATSQTPTTRPGRHRIPRGHTPPEPAQGGHSEGPHDGDYAAKNVDLPGLLARLSNGRDNLSLLADLTDEQLNAVPPNGNFRFCDGQRALEQVVASLLNHQAHQIDAVKAAIT